MPVQVTVAQKIGPTAGLCWCPVALLQALKAPSPSNITTCARETTQAARCPGPLSAGGPGPKSRHSPPATAPQQTRGRHPPRLLLRQAARRLALSPSSWAPPQSAAPAACWPLRAAARPPAPPARGSPAATGSADASRAAQHHAPHAACSGCPKSPPQTAQAAKPPLWPRWAATETTACCWLHQSQQLEEQQQAGSCWWLHPAPPAEPL